MWSPRLAAVSEFGFGAGDAYLALESTINSLLTQTAARSALGLQVIDPDDAEGEAFMALGWVLPSIVGGLRDDPFLFRERTTFEGLEPRTDASMVAPDPDLVRRARNTLERFTVLAFEGGQLMLEAAVAGGFKADALWHARGSGQSLGPGWMVANQQLAVLGLRCAEYWYARTLLSQALALYAIAGGNRSSTLRLFEEFRGEWDHPLMRQAAALARKAVEAPVGEARFWQSLIWDDEGQVAGRSQALLDDRAAQLVADISLLLNLNHKAPTDRRPYFGYMRDLPYCLSLSPDRAELVGRGCPARCGWALCHHVNFPPDDPDWSLHLSRAFCRQQQQIAERRSPAWHRRISRRRLKKFWWQMETRART